jgi:hypothetical protein
MGHARKSKVRVTDVSRWRGSLLVTGWESLHQNRIAYSDSYFLVK